MISCSSREQEHEVCSLSETCIWFYLCYLLATWPHANLSLSSNFLLNKWGKLSKACLLGFFSCCCFVLGNEAVPFCQVQGGLLSH